MTKRPHNRRNIGYVSSISISEEEILKDRWPTWKCALREAYLRGYVTWEEVLAEVYTREGRA